MLKLSCAINTTTGTDEKQKAVLRANPTTDLDKAQLQALPEDWNTVDELALCIHCDALNMPHFSFCRNCASRLQLETISIDTIESQTVDK